MTKYYLKDSKNEIKLYLVLVPILMLFLREKSTKMNGVNFYEDEEWGIILRHNQKNNYILACFFAITFPGAKCCCILELNSDLSTF